MSFSGQDNKRLLWGLMADNNVFAGIPDTKVEEVKSLFEQEITKVTTAQGSLLEKNKHILASMNTKLNFLRVSAASQESGSAVTNKDLAQERKEAMNNKLQNKQEEFNKLISSDKPKDIDFSDQPDEKPIGSEMDSLLASMMERRKSQLNQVISSQDPEAAEKWIGNQGSGTEVNMNPPTLQIGETVETPNITVVNNTPKLVPEKHVTFSTDTNETETESNNATSLDLFQFLSVNKSNTDAPFMPPEDKTDDNKPDIMGARAAVTAETNRLAENEIMQRLSRIEHELIEIKDLLKNA